MTGLYSPHQLNSSPMIKKMQFISELFHQKYAPATFYVNMIFSCRIRYFIRIKTATLIRDCQQDLVRHFLAGDNDLLMIVKTVAMLHRVVYSFCQADKDVRIQIRIDIEPCHQPLNKVLHFQYATWIGRKL